LRRRQLAASQSAAPLASSPLAPMDQLIHPGRLQAHQDRRGAIDDQHHPAPALLDGLGAGDQSADADRGEKLEGGQVNHHAFLGRGDQLLERRGHRVGAGNVEAATDHDAPQIVADVAVADGHGGSTSS